MDWRGQQAVHRLHTVHELLLERKVTQAEHLNGDRNALLRKQLDQFDQEVHAGQAHLGRCEGVQQMDRLFDELAVIFPL